MYLCTLLWNNSSSLDGSASTDRCQECLLLLLVLVLSLLLANCAGHISSRTTKRRDGVRCNHSFFTPAFMTELYYVRSYVRMSTWAVRQSWLCVSYLVGFQDDLTHNSWGKSRQLNSLPVDRQTDGRTDRKIQGSIGADLRSRAKRAELVWLYSDTSLAVEAAAAVDGWLTSWLLYVARCFCQIRWFYLHLWLFTGGTFQK